MIIGVPKEIKNNENRVAITASGVKKLTEKNHKVIIEESAGKGSGISDKDFKNEGAHIYKSREKVFSEAEMIIKVKEPLPEEYSLLNSGQILFTYLHLAAKKELTEVLIKKQITAIAYETVELENGYLPLLAPMSEIAGKLAAQEGIFYLKNSEGGRGILPGGVPGVEPAQIMILGGGMVGKSAAKIANGLGADITIFEIDIQKMRYLEEFFQGNIKTKISNKFNIYQEIVKTDMVIGAVLIPGAETPKLVTENMVKDMKKGTVVVDVAIDQGGCVETTYPTTHENPVFQKHGVNHYSVANIPGIVARTSTFALTNATLPYILEIADQGCEKAFTENPDLLKGLNIYDGKITYPKIAESFNKNYTNPRTLF